MDASGKGKLNICFFHKFSHPFELLTLESIIDNDLSLIEFSSFLPGDFCRFFRLLSSLSAKHFHDIVASLCTWIFMLHIRLRPRIKYSYTFFMDNCGSDEEIVLGRRKRNLCTITENNWNTNCILNEVTK